ncbi:hypothetical protein MAPG_05903 [Magnaporthiopsis poae ATCC 64411]|uniref:Uncharacterized protein n=1 Tax=Magnaporthiopsis poae (strain ATCC 64411 / 73-15) TaxID=644358 RepID=A0A0C4E0M2_MAGP6|nr:hypothetical protein MAPG_05903 [Magnaporthiopsis poae ATCC 64411]
MPGRGRKTRILPGYNVPQIGFSVFRIRAPTPYIDGVDLGIDGVERWRQKDGEENTGKKKKERTSCPLAGIKTRVPNEEPLGSGCSLALQTSSTLGARFRAGCAGRASIRVLDERWLDKRADAPASCRAQIASLSGEQIHFFRLDRASRWQHAGNMAFLHEVEGGEERCRSFWLFLGAAGYGRRQTSVGNRKTVLLPVSPPRRGALVDC